MKRSLTRYVDARDFVLDPKGYFLIRVNYRSKTIEAGFCTPKGKITQVFSGKTPVALYTLISQKLLSLRKEHYAYLGRELEKAYDCLWMGLEYYQDDELKDMLPRRKKTN